MPDQVSTEPVSSIHLYRVLEDEYLNLYGPLPAAYPWLFLQSHIKDRRNIIAQIKQARTKLHAYLKDRLESLFLKQVRKTESKLGEAAPTDPAKKAYLAAHLTRLKELQTLPDYPHNDPRGKDLRDALVEIFNEILTDQSFYSVNQPFLGVNIKNDTERLIAEHLKPGTSPNLTVICRINRFLLEDAFPNELEGRDLENIEAAHRSYIAAIYSAIHKRERSALCLSGGGVRSATFNLGVLQGLARHGLLDKFDYLSTVSGGGYIGSWLSSWINREPGGLDAVMKKLSHKPASVRQPEPDPIRHLRDYSNYLSPRYGLLSADTWTLVAIVARNLLLNWLVFIPLLTAVIMTPRLYVSAFTQGNRAFWVPFMLVLAVAAKLLAIGYLAYTLPSSGRRNNSQKEFLTFGLLPLGVSMMLFTLAWAWCQWSDYDWLIDRKYFAPDTKLPARYAIIGSILMGLFGLAVYTVARLRRRYNPSQRPRWKIALMIMCVGGVVVLISGLLGFTVWKVSNWPRLNPVINPHAFATVAVPFLLLCYGLGGTLVAGFTSKWFEEDDLEWWARCGAWILIVTFGWAVITLLVFYGPSIPARIQWPDTWSDWKFIGPALTTIIGIISGVITLLGGFSAGTPAHRQQETPGGITEVTREKPSLLHRITPFAAPAFMVFIVVVLSLGTNWLIVQFASLIPRLASLGNSILQTMTYWLFEMRLLSGLGSLLSALHSPFALRGGVADWTKHSDVISYTPFALAFTVWVLLIALGWIMARVINTNVFSIHSLYGNRLKRAYLGASRLSRTPHRFTGFDSTDNLQMHELRTELFNRNSFSDLHGLTYKLKQPAPDDQFSNHLRGKLAPTTVQMLDRLVDPQQPSPELVDTLIEDLNRLLHTDSLYDKQRFPNEKLREQTRALLARPPLDESRVLLNRWLLEDAYHNEIKHRKSPRLLHVVNIALNLVRGERLAWQERKAQSFTVSPLHSGNLWLGYRRSRYYGGENGISLGTAFTISGAAASPNMGYMVSSPLVSFLMAMFNIRLGWWLGNPGSAGNQTHQLAVPRFTFGPIVQEALSLTDDNSKYVYLSDGGHFENLGLYEMVLRRCKVIVVSDATTDSNYNYDSLGMAIRKIRIDLGIPIDMDNFDIAPDNPNNPYFTLGRIRYSCVDDDGTDGTLVYIKASLSRREPRDIVNYWRANRDFPQEAISDQFFIESQFESYRMLGSHIVSSMCAGRDGDPEWQANGLSEFVDRLMQSHSGVDGKRSQPSNGRPAPAKSPGKRKQNHRPRPQPRETDSVRL